MDNSEMVCYCAQVTRGDIIAAMERGARTMADIKRMTGVCVDGNCENLSPRKT